MPDTSLTLVPATPLRHILRVRGVDLHWVELGVGTPLVLLHGLCDSHRTWRHVAPALAVTYRVIMPDLPGHGLSDRPDASYALEWYAELIAAWADDLGLDTFDLVGHSFGGGIAQMLLLRIGERVKRLALVASGGLGKEVSLGLRLWSMTGLVERVAQPLMGHSTRIGMSKLLPSADAADIDFLCWYNAMPGSARALSRTVAQAIDWRGQKRGFWSEPHALTALPPTALFWGDSDPVVPFDHGLAFSAKLPLVKLTRFEQCGHFPHQERPELFAAALLGFLATEAASRQALPSASELVVETVAAPAYASPPWWTVILAWMTQVIAWLFHRSRVGPTPKPELTTGGDPPNDPPLN